MANSNYRKGRAFEYKVMADLREKGYDDVSRTAGSHGQFDIYALHPNGNIILGQCKVVDDAITAARISRQFKEDPPRRPGTLPKGVHQMLFLKTKGSSTYVSQIL